MKKINTQLIAIILILLLGCEKQKGNEIIKDPEKLLEKKARNDFEDFNEFFIEFSENDLFQKDRIMFPFIEEYYSDDEGADSTIYKSSADLKTHYCLIDTCNGVKSLNYLTYGNENKSEIDSITFSSSLVDNFSNSNWCFKRIKSKWFLVRRISYS